MQVTKYCILTPVKIASTEEVAETMVKGLMSYFEPTVVTITNQITHFRNRLLEEFARLFKNEKYCTMTYHPQFNRGIARMYHTITEYLKAYVST